MHYEIIADETIKVETFETLNECKDWVEKYLALNGFGQFKTIKIYDYGFSENPTLMEGYYAEPDTTTSMKTALDLIASLRNEGWAVILWTPQELDGADPYVVESSSVEHGWVVIEMNKETDQ
jgi:hypothetical protein